MKYTTASVLAAVAGTTVADTWADWSSTTTTTAKWVDPTTSVTWPAWTSSKKADPTSSTWAAWSTTTSKKADPTSAWPEWSTSKKADPTSTWAEWTTTTSKKADPTSVWADWSSTTSKKADATSAYTWADWSSSSAVPVKASTSAPGWPVQASVAPAVCNVVTVTVTGQYVWVPTPDPTWADWTTSKSVTPVKATTTSAWQDWTTSKKADPTKATTSTWSDWDPTTTTTKAWPAWTSSAKKADPTWTTTTTWADWSSTTLSTAYYTTTKSSPTTTTAAASAATCPADNGQSLEAGGSCGCSFTVNCGVHAVPNSDSKFWGGNSVDTLAECLTICDNNADCEATVWVDDSSSSDYHLCWQVSGLPQPSQTGVGQISYKGSCSGSCSSTYNS